MTARTILDNFLNFYLILKGTVSVVIRKYLCKDGNVRFTSVPLMPLNVHRGERTPCVYLSTFVRILVKGIEIENEGGYMMKPENLRS